MPIYIEHNLPEYMVLLDHGTHWGSAWMTRPQIIMTALMRADHGLGMIVITRGNVPGPWFQRNIRVRFRRSLL